MQLFIDNDILLKLGSADLLPKLSDIFNVDNKSIFILPTAKPYITNNKKLVSKYSKETLTNILDNLNNYSIIPDDYLAQDIFIKLSDIPDIDSGEQILFSLRPPGNNFLILTGDKLSIQALYSKQSIKVVAEDLKHKIVCLEYLFLRMIEMEECELFSDKIKRAGFCGDKTIELVFGQSSLTIDLIREGLMSYFGDLNRKVDNYLFTI